MKKTNKKLTLTAILAASALTFAGCGHHGNVTPETESVRETDAHETEEESQSVTDVESEKEETKDITRAGGDGDGEEELIDFNMEENVNVCVYGPPPEDE